MTKTELRDMIVAVLEGARQRGEHALLQTTPVAETDNVIGVETEEGELFFVEVTPA